MEIEPHSKSKKKLKKIKIRKYQSQIYNLKNGLQISNEDKIICEEIYKTFDKNKFYLKLFTQLKKIEKEIENKNFQNQNRESPNIIKKIKINDEKKIEIDENLRISLEKIQEKRTYKDIINIKNYLSKTKLASYLKELKIEENSHEEILIILSFEMKLLKYNKDDIIYKIGDSFKYFYLIISGKVEIIKFVKKEKFMTGYDYFSYLMDLKKNNEIEKYNITIKENKNFYIYYEDKDIIHFYYIKNIINQIINGFIIDFKESLKLCNIEPEFFNLDVNHLDSLKYIIEKNKDIIAKIPELNKNQIPYYLFFHDNFTKKKISIFNLQTVSFYEPNDFFGYCSDNKLKSEETIKVIEDSLVIYSENALFEKFLLKFKQSLIKKDLDFLRNNFIFGKISKTKFEKQYLQFFNLEEYQKGDFLSYENEPLKYIFFIKSGEVELYSKKNIIEIHYLLNQFKKVDEKNENLLIYKYNNLKTNFSELQKSFEEKKLIKIMTLKDIEIIGLESIFYRKENFTTSKISINNTIIYKISVEDFIQIFENEKKHLITSIENYVKNRLEILYNRFFNINNIKMSLSDLKENFNQKIVYEKDLISQENINEKNKLKKNKEIFFEVNKNKIKRKSSLPNLKKYLFLNKITLKTNDDLLNSKKVRKKRKSADKILQSNISSNKSTSYISFENQMLKKIIKNMKKDSQLIIQKEKSYFTNSCYLTNIDTKINKLTNNYSSNLSKNISSKISNKFSFFTQFPNIKKNKNNIKSYYNIYNPRFSNNKNSNTIFEYKKKRVYYPYSNSLNVEKIKKYDIFEQSFNKLNLSDDNIKTTFSNYRNRIDLRNKLKIENIKKKALIYKNYKNQIRDSLLLNE